MKYFLESPDNRAAGTQETHWQIRKLWGIYLKGFLLYHFFAFRVINSGAYSIRNQLPVSWLPSPNYHKWQSEAMKMSLSFMDEDLLNTPPFSAQPLGNSL